MSSVRIADFKNRADLEKKRKEAAALLEIEIENENRVAAARQRGMQNIPISEVAAFDPRQVIGVDEKIKSALVGVSREQEDKALERQQAFNNLKSIVKSKDVSPILYKLQDDNEIELFNRFFTQFKQQIGGQANITPTIFDAAWNKFKTILTKTGNTGIALASTTGEYDAELKQIQTKLSVLGQDTEMNDDAVELMGFDTDTLDVAFEAAYDSTTGGDLKNEVKNVGDTTGPITIDLPKDTYQFMIGIDATGNYILRKINKLGMQYGSWNLRNTEKIYYILKDKYEVDLQAEIKWTGDPATVIYPNTRSLATKVKAARIKVAGVGMSMRAKYLHGITPQQQIIGCGLQTEEKRLKIDTMKISSMPKETQLKTGKHTPNFGNYCVSLKNLKRGFLTISYPSGSVVSLFPKTLISNTLRRIINDIIFEKSFDEKDYASLEEDEKKLFDDLLTYTRADNKSIVELYRHKKYNDESRDADVKRFNLLKGQLVAGNTNPELLKELKVLLFRLYDERVILLRDFQKLLAQLVAIC